MNKKELDKRASLLRDVVYSANDGVITVFAVIAGSTGASFDTRVIIILGFANLIADGFSMATGVYLGIKSQIDYEKASGVETISDSPMMHAVLTFISFALVGVIPLLPYLILEEPNFGLSIFMVGLTLFLIGSLRNIFTKKGWIKSGLEMLFVGGLAATLAYGVGFALDKYVL